MENEDGDELTAFDIERLDPSSDVKLNVKWIAVQEAQERLAPLELESAV